MNAKDIEDKISQGLPGADVRVEDTRGDGRHFTAMVVCAAFEGKTRIQQHQMVYRTLGDSVGNAVHALELVTRTPADAQVNKG